MPRGWYRPPAMGMRLAWESWSAVRRQFLASRPANLDYLLRRRYEWMNELLPPGCRVMEVGAGAGFSNAFLRQRAWLSDVQCHPWLDMAADAHALPLRSGSLGALICCHTLHHLARPRSFLAEAHRVLQPGGYLLIQDMNTSLLLRTLLRLLRHEGWSYDVEVFDESTWVSAPDDPDDCNCAVMELLFADARRFEEQVSGFEIVRNETCEVLVWLLSGGVNAKLPTLNLPFPALRGLDRLDAWLARVAPKLLALGRRVALRRKEETRPPLVGRSQQG